ncbi:hypothetical protein [Helicobacter pullorum]|uniref:hypothetical protein n=1 Tax=Helicobacter pullorum TaxID=35818 RepID=UPI00174C637F|nr:hypothetical protein [Helicobacter pullorum]
MQRVVLIALVVLLSACVKYSVPDIAFKQKNFSVEIDGVKYIAYVFKDGNYRFILFDALGVPQADMNLVAGRFQTNKFLPNKNFHRQIFLEILNMLKDGRKSKGFQLGNKEIRILEF